MCLARAGWAHSIDYKDSQIMPCTIAFDDIPAHCLPTLLKAMPKAELHIHIEGSLEPELIFQLARRNGIALPYPNVGALRAAYAFSNLQSFLDVYYAGASVLQQEQDFFDMAWAYLTRPAAENVVHAELSFDPQTHTQRGIATGTIILGLSRACQEARDQLGVDAHLILCFLRHLSEASALETLEQLNRAYEALFIEIRKSYPGLITIINAGSSADLELFRSFITAG